MALVALGEVYTGTARLHNGRFLLAFPFLPNPSIPKVLVFWGRGTLYKGDPTPLEAVSEQTP